MNSTAWHHLHCVACLFDPQQLRDAGIDVATQFNPWWVMGYGRLQLKDKTAVTEVIISMT